VVHAPSTYLLVFDVCVTVKIVCTEGCTLSVIGVVQSARCDGQSQVFHSGKHDPSPSQQQQPQGQCAAAGVYGRLGGLTVSTGLGGACPQQHRGVSVSSVLTAAFRASAAATPADPAAIAASVAESAFYFQDGGGYRTIPVAGAPMTGYYEKCAI